MKFSSKTAITKMQAIIIAMVIVVAGIGAAAYYLTRPQPVLTPIKIGYIGNLSWPIAETASYVAKLAVDEINEAGGILGRNITLIVEDSKGEVPTAVAAYRKLVMTDGVLSVIVAEGSELNFACQEEGAKLYPEYPHLCCNPCTSHIGLTENVLNNYDKYKFYFRNFINTTDYWTHIIENEMIMINNLKPKKMALIIEDALWTKIFREGQPGAFPPFKELIEKQLGVQVVYYTETAVTEKMFLPIFEAIAATQPDYIHFLGAYSDDAALVKQWASSAAKDIDLYVQGGYCQTPGYWEMTGGAALGIVTSYYAVKAAITNKTVPYMNALEKKYGKQPNWVCSGTYDWIYMLKEAIEKCKTTDVETLIKELEKMEYTGVVGCRRYYPGTHSAVYSPGDLTKGTIDLRIQYQKNGEIVVVYPKDVAERTNPGKGFISIKVLRGT